MSRLLSRVYHLVDLANWAAVQAAGLLPADTLIRWAYSGDADADADAHLRSPAQARPDTPAVRS